MTMAARGARSIPQRAVLADGVYEAIKGLIMDRELEPGVKINMDQLARDLDVSPTPVREALSRLEGDGLVSKRALSGYSTAPLLNISGVQELFEMRLLLEPAAARWAASASSEAMDGLSGLIERAGQAASAAPTASDESFQDYRDVVMHDQLFHEAISHASGRSILPQMLERLQPHAQLYRIFHRPGVDDQTHAEHVAIFEALRRGDGEAAAVEMTTHLTRACDRVLDALGESDA